MAPTAHKEKRIVNFGNNVSFVPKFKYSPKNEAELLKLLDLHSGGKIRVAGSLHSWSDVVQSEDVIVDMREFDSVKVVQAADGSVMVEVGAGCTIKKLLSKLHRATNATLPTLGAITQQTIAGAIATGTHGSGANTLSHYVDELRVAAYDPETGKAKIYEWNTGMALRAARCSIGYMGIVLSVKFKCVPKYYVRESIVARDTLEEILHQETQFPLQYFLLFPFLWSFIVFQRQATTDKPSRIQIARAMTQRLINFIAVDFLGHGALSLLAPRLRSPGRVRILYRIVLSRFLGRKRLVVDESQHILTLNHQFFKHLEMEISVPAKHIIRATELIRHVTSIFAGVPESLPDTIGADLASVGLLNALHEHEGDHTHHYPIAFRLVHPDDTLISMSSGSDESYYAISFFTYVEPRTKFYRYADFLARSLTRLYDARLHWGKYYPLTHDEIAHLYPRLDEFRETCQKSDPLSVFSNDYAERVLGFPSGVSGSPTMPVA